MKQKLRKSDKSKSKTVNKLVPPSDTWDPAVKPYKNDQKVANSFFQKELEMKEQEHLNDMKKATGLINKVEKDTNRIRKRQRFEYGMTLDEIDSIREEIESIKVQNAKLYEEMAHSKAISDKLEKELEDTKRRYSETKEKLIDSKRESKTWQETKEKLIRTEARVNQLFKRNRKLRTVLLKHKVDPNIDAREIFYDNNSDGEGSNKSLKSNKTFPKESKYFLRIEDRWGTIEELQQLRKEKRQKGSKREYGFLDAVFNQMNPAYFGYYTRRKERKPQPKVKQSELNNKDITRMFRVEML